MFSRTIGAVAALSVMALASQSLAQPPVAKPQPPPPVTATPATSGAPAPAAQPPAAKPVAPTATPVPAPQAVQTAAPKVQPPAGADTAPTSAQLGVQVYEGARYLGSYDAGRGQRYYLFGATQSFAEIVAYYKTVLKDKGELVFEQPPTHMFDIGKFKEETMAFPPSVTVKDYMGSGAAGYANPYPGSAPTAFPTVIQIVPAPAPEVRK